MKLIFAFSGNRNALFIDSSVEDNPERIDRKRAEEIKDQLQGEPLILDSLKVQECSEGPPKLYDLDSLQTDANAQLGMTAEETLAAAQMLYERKLISYPRTDCTYLSSKDLYILPDILDGIKQNLAYKGFVDEIEVKNMQFNLKFIDDSKITEHSAIIPTTNALKGGLNEKYIALYDLILKRFISSFYEAYTFSNLSAVFKSEKEVGGFFIYSSNFVKNIGWKKVYGDVEIHSPPVLSEGDKYPIGSLDIKDKKTRPPSRFTDGTLVQSMKNCGRSVEDAEARQLMGGGIGTPATRAGIIETLISKTYIQRVGKSIYATPKGIELINLIQDESLKSPTMTGSWEKKRSLIESGNYDPDLFISEIVQMIKEIVSSLFPDVVLNENGGIIKSVVPELTSAAVPKTIVLSIKPLPKKEIVLSILKK